MVSSVSIAYISVFIRIQGFYIQYPFTSSAIVTIETETPWATFIRLNLQVGKYFPDQPCWQIMKTDIAFVLVCIRNRSSSALVEQLWRLHTDGAFSCKTYREELITAWKASLVTVPLYVSFPNCPNMCLCIIMYSRYRHRSSPHHTSQRVQTTVDHNYCLPVELLFDNTSSVRSYIPTPGSLSTST